MVKLLQLLLTYKFRTTKPAQKNGGFTLIELLVGIILAFLVIIPLLGFMVNLLRTDRQEQAKANSEQELQAAADYIARDVEQAVYIYDGYGLNKIKNNLPPHPDAANSVPVLAFWKRQILPKVIPVGNSTACQNQNDTCDDAFVYSLVVYYLTKSDATCASSPWSCTARISRVQLRDAVKDKDGNPLATDPSDKRAASPGFVLFNPKLVPTSEEDSMNAWPGTTPPTYNANTPQPEVLIDYIDQSPFNAATQGCPPITRTRTNLPADYVLTTASQVPVAPTAAGFSACVGVENTSAQIFLRGNSLARIQPKKPNPPGYSNAQSASTYFPTVRVQVQGRGVFKINQKS